MDKFDRSIVGVYDNEREAIRAVEELKSQGYRAEDISIIGKNSDEVDTVTEETGTKTGEGAASGAAAGGALGGLTGLLAGVGALAIPGIGPIVAAGPLAATLAGAAAGAGVGGIAGALIGLGVPEEEADRYDAYVKEGKILVLVGTDEDRGSGTFGNDTDRDRSAAGTGAATSGGLGTRDAVRGEFLGENNVTGGSLGGVNKDYSIDERGTSSLVDEDGMGEERRNIPLRDAQIDSSSSVNGKFHQ
ncbi:hypothetical protein GJU40_17395 [Bacillus lacus]|uniref:General stress protein 17M-like domain-containing protein n=1 Tax=Metabacillus lacus TaxID=1983721 RepID=A0A7X2M0C0_9BACI|nr:general stress protein [Metabacillus lacus]MRX73913.1 hypothetical protein [Metabacillus lacus]